MLLDEAREEFPRLYFLADKELVELLSVSRNPQALMPFAKKCFHGIHSLTYALPVDLANSAMSSLDFTLNGKSLFCKGKSLSTGDKFTMTRRVLKK